VADLSNAFDPVKFLELQGVQNDIVNQFKDQMLAGYQVMKEQASREAANLIANIRRESDTAELCRRVTAGSEDAPRGLPGVIAKELQERLLALPFEQAKFWGGLLENIVKTNLVEFAEIGHGKRQAGAVELPTEVIAGLNKGELSVNDLSNPILGLGDLTQYNLSMWTGAKK
jgi:hypothetical protein